MTKHNRSEPVDKGTKQTRARLREGTVARLIRTKRIGGEELMAVQEIERVWYALTSRMFAKAGHYGERLDPSADRDWSDSLVSAHGRYLDWVAALEPGVLSVVVDALIDLRPAREIDRDHKWPPDTTCSVLVSALRLYAEMAGWLSRAKSA